MSFLRHVSRQTDRDSDCSTLHTSWGKVMRYNIYLSVVDILQRKWAVLSLGQQVNIRPHAFDPKQDYLGAMVVEVDFLMKKKLVFVVIIII